MQTNTTDLKDNPLPRQKQRRIFRHCYSRTPQELIAKWRRQAMNYRSEALSMQRFAAQQEDFMARQFYVEGAHAYRREARTCYEHIIQFLAVERERKFGRACVAESNALETALGLRFSMRAMLIISVRYDCFLGLVADAKGQTVHTVRCSSIADCATALRAWYLASDFAQERQVAA